MKFSSWFGAGSLAATVLLSLSFQSLAQTNVLVAPPTSWGVATWLGNLYAQNRGAACEAARAQDAGILTPVSVSGHNNCTSQHMHSFTVTASVSGSACLIDVMVHDCDNSFPASEEPTNLYLFPVCPSGFAPDDSHLCIGETPVTNEPTGDDDLPPDLGSPDDCPPGNPINPANGNKLQTEVDYSSPFSNGFPIIRTYNSLANTVNEDHQATENVGTRWSINLDIKAIVHYSDRYDDLSEEFVPTITKATLIRGDGKRITFTLKRGTSNEIIWGNSLIGLSNPLETVEIVPGTSLVYRAENGDIETYEFVSTVDNLEWMSISSIVHGDGTTAAFSYTSGKLTGVTQTPGADYALSYDGNDRIDEITVPSGTITYAYSSGNLVSVTYPDNSVRSYVYEDTNFPHALTGIIDEKNVRYATYAYDNQERGVLSKHAGDTNLYAFTYNPEMETIVTDPLSNSITYQHQQVNGRGLRTEVSSLSTTCSSTAVHKSFDTTTGKLVSETDANNNQTTYDYDNNGYSVSVTNDLQEQIVYNYLDAARLDSVVSGNTEIDFEYDSNDRLETKTFRDLSNSAEQTWTYSYNTAGRIASINGPRTDVSDTTSFTYYTNGNLNTVTNALSQTTTYENYTGDGRVGKITYPDDRITNITYTSRGWINTVTTQGMLTDFDYDEVGNLIKTTYPNGSFFEYEYDNAHRLIAIEDYDGNRIEYTLDDVGNRINTEIFNSSSALVYEKEQTFNDQGRLYEVIDALNQTISTLEYDDNGNVSGKTDGNSNHITYGYDHRNRINSIYHDELSVGSSMSYNISGLIDSVGDFISEFTHHYYDGLNQLTELASPDTGSTNLTYDDASNIAVKVDAESRSLDHTYDALNRLTEVEGINYGLVFGYDEETNSVGRLGSVEDDWGFTKWLYNNLGLVSEKSQTPTGGTALSSEYSYTTSGDLEEIEYPSGAIVTYVYGANGKASSIKINNVTKLSNIKYQPFGDVLEWNTANSVNYARVYNQNGLISSITYPNTTRNYHYDNNFNITEIEDTNYSSESQFMGYDAGDRLISYMRNSVTTEWVYDGNGNRTFETTGTLQRSYYLSGNRLMEIYRDDLSTTEESFTYDNTGNVVSRGAVDYTYNEGARLVEVSNGSLVANYSYNGLGQRVQKTVASLTTHFFYDETGHLLGEYTGALSTEYVWLGDTPVAVIVNNGTTSTIYYIHPDHLNTPRFLTDSNGTIVWRWDGDAFGRGLANEDPDLNSHNVTMNLRFPGQQFDEETELHYNYFRDYDPSIGRYIESDPIGLEGGINTYAYAGGNPISNVDPDGLLFIDPTGRIPDDASGPTPRGSTEDKCGCFEKLFGIDTAAGTAMVAGGQPITDKKFTQAKTSKKTSPISKGLSKAFPQKLPFRVWAPTTNRPLATSPKVGRIVGRWVPYVGWGILATDLNEYNNCLFQCTQCGSSN